MKILIVGSRSMNELDLEKYIPKDVDMIISGGAKGIDTIAEMYADKHKISKLIVRPDYQKYGKAAPLLAKANLNRTRLSGEKMRYFSKTRSQSPHFASFIFKKYHHFFAGLGKNYFKRADFSYRKSKRRSNMRILQGFLTHLYGKYAS